MLAILGREPIRAAYIHAIIIANGYDQVVTHIFEPNCPYLQKDAVFGVKQSLIGDFRKIADIERADKLGFGRISEFWEVNVDFILTPASGRDAFLYQV